MIEALSSFLSPPSALPGGQGVTAPAGGPASGFAALLAMFNAGGQPPAALTSPDARPGVSSLLAALGLTPAAPGASAAPQLPGPGVTPAEPGAASGEPSIVADAAAALPAWWNVIANLIPAAKADGTDDNPAIARAQAAAERIAGLMAAGARHIEADAAPGDLLGALAGRLADALGGKPAAAQSPATSAAIAAPTSGLPLPAAIPAAQASLPVAPVLAPASPGPMPADASVLVRAVQAQPANEPASIEADEPTVPVTPGTGAVKAPAGLVAAFAAAVPGLAVAAEKAASPAAVVAVADATGEAPDATGGDRSPVADPAAVAPPPRAADGPGRPRADGRPGRGDPAEPSRAAGPRERRHAADGSGAVDAAPNGTPGPDGNPSETGALARAADDLLPRLDSTASARAPLSESRPDPAALAARLGEAIAGRAHRGDSRFEIRLDPPELGRVDVELRFSADGEMRARLMVERSDTLDLLARDRSALERTLQSAGIRAADGGVDISLRDFASGNSNSGGNGNGQGWSQQQPQEHGRHMPAYVAAGFGRQSDTPVLLASPQRPPSGRLDLTV